MRTWKYVTIVVVVLSAVTICRADRYVSTNGLHQNSFTNWTDAATNVQDAVAAASAGETVWVSNGTYVCTSPVSVSYNGGSSPTMILLDKAITLRSMNGWQVTTLDGNGSAGAQRHVIATTASATVAGFTITGGYITDSPYSTWPHYNGGGVLRAGSGAPTVSNCLITGCYSSKGGSALGWMRGGTAVDCVVSNNTGPTAVRLREGGRLVRCDVVDHPGGGIWFQDEGGVVEECTSAGNGAYTSTQGAGAYLSNGGTIRNSLIRDNLGKRGVGIYVYYSAGRSPTVQNCTVVQNQGNASGGGIYLNDAAGAGTDAVLENTILVYNSGGYNEDIHPPDGVDGAGGVTGVVQAAYNYCEQDLSSFGSGNIQGTNPQFLDAGADDFQIKLGSPCMDKGTNATWITGSTVDLKGNPRIHGSHVDIGAYEESTPIGTVVSVK